CSSGSSSNDSASSGDSSSSSSSSSDTTTGSDTGSSTGGGGTTLPTSEINKFGVVSISHDASSDVTTPGGFFVGFENPLAASFTEGAVNAALDTCEVTTTTDEDLLDPSDFIPGVDGADLGAFTTLSAGEVLPITGDSGSYAELTRQSVGQGPINFIGYALANEDGTLAGTPPTNLSINIPGDDFPAFGDQSFPSVEALSLTAPTTLAEVTTSSTFLWTAGTATGGFVSIDLSATEINLETFAFSSTDISCLVNDDGEFTLPANVAAEAGADFTPDYVDVSRIAFKFVEQNGATLLLTRDSSVSFESDFFGDGAIPQ
ncbi:MAG: hypothetical protein ACWA44_07030, partial [Thiotrichales bacterium]